MTLLVALSAAALAGCTVTASEPAGSAESPAVTLPSAEPTPGAEPAPNVDPGVGPTDDAGCAGLSKILFPGSSEGDEEPAYMAQWNGWDPVDNGPTDLARGTVTKTPDGRIATYTVAEGDAPLVVGERLCVDIGSIMRYNRLGSMLYAGDVLTLGPGALDPFSAEPFTEEPQRR